MPFRIILIISLLFCALASNAQEEVLVFDSSSNAVKIDSHLQYFIDIEGTLDATKAIEVDSNLWQVVPKDSESFSFVDHVHWFQFIVRNEGNSKAELFLHLDYALIDSVEFNAFHVVDGGLIQAESYHVGDQFPYAQRPVDHPTFLFPFTLHPNETKRIIMRTETSGTLQVPLSIWEQTQFLINAQNVSFLYGFFLSALLIMSAYYSCLFLMVKDKGYLIYAAFIVCMAGVHASLDGYTYKWFWPNSPEWHQISAIAFIAVGLIATVFFTRTILPIPRHSLIDKTTIWLGALAVSSAILSVFISYKMAAMLNGIMTVIVMSIVFVVCIAMLKHSPRIAKFLCFAWSAYFAGIVLKSAAKLGYLPSTAMTEYSGNIGAVVGIIVIALALADRINTERRRREKAQEESISNLKRFETLYENAIEGIFSVTDKGYLLGANPAFMKLIGLSKLSEYDGDWSKLKGYVLEENNFRNLLKAVRVEGQVVDHETQMINKGGASIWVNISARYFVHGEQGKIEGTVIDISERKAFEQQLQHLAQHDPLTGFLNRRAFEASAKDMLSQVQEHNQKVCLLYLDLDQFKIVNDLCGHTAGDLLLQKLSQRLLEEVKTFGDHQVIARLGGDEFGILLSKMSLLKAQQAAEMFRKKVEDFLFVWEGKRYAVGVSIGLVELLPYHHSVEQVLVMADTACYMAKDQGRNRVHVFVESDKELQFRQLEMQWVSTIKEALEKDQFFLVFQNIRCNKESEHQHHYEILIRLMNANGNLCSPGQFLPAAERYNLMPNIDRWVVTHYFNWLKTHPEHLESLSCASINLSTQSIGDENFAAFLIDAFEEYDIPGSKICFEITEGMAIVHLDNTQAFIDRFRRLGCRFALDDFGTGFSSYAYLKELQVDYLKIDGIFIKNLCEDDVNLAMVRSISEVARAIGIETVAEFVENEQTRQVLIDIGISYSQGYHIHQPTQLGYDAFKQLEPKS